MTMARLTPHQELSARAHRLQLEKMHPKDLADHAQYLFEQMLYRENSYKELLAHGWGLDVIGQYSGPVNDDGV